jgi:hypothetical protein
MMIMRPPQHGQGCGLSLGPISFAFLLLDKSNPRLRHFKQYSLVGRVRCGMRLLQAFGRLLLIILERSHRDAVRFELQHYLKSLLSSSEERPLAKRRSRRRSSDFVFGIPQLTRAGTPFSLALGATVCAEF